LEEITLNYDENIFIQTIFKSIPPVIKKISYEKIFHSNGYTNTPNTKSPYTNPPYTKIVKIISEISGQHKFMYLNISTQRIYKLNKTEEIIKDIIE
jgi:hypothetical protein